MTQQTVTLWDPLVRFFHWSLVLIFISNYFINEPGSDWHQLLGYGALLLLMIRFVWGFVGKGAAKWQDFFPTPKRLWLHASALLTGKPYHRMGHSPIGALVMILMMLTVLGLVCTGMMMTVLEAFSDEYWPEEVHGVLANGLLSLAIVHVLAAIVESVRMKENLPLSMIHGKRRIRDKN